MKSNTRLGRKWPPVHSDTKKAQPPGALKPESSTQFCFLYIPGNVLFTSPSKVCDLETIWGVRRTLQGKIEKPKMETRQWWQRTRRLHFFSIWLCRYSVCISTPPCTRPGVDNSRLFHMPRDLGPLQNFTWSHWNQAGSFFFYLLSFQKWLCPCGSVYLF